MWLWGIPPFFRYFMHNHFSETAFSSWVSVTSTGYYAASLELTLSLREKPREGVGCNYWVRWPCRAQKVSLGKAIQCDHLVKAFPSQMSKETPDRDKVRGHAARCGRAGNNTWFGVYIVVHVETSSIPPPTTLVQLFFSFHAMLVVSLPHFPVSVLRPQCPDYTR